MPNAMSKAPNVAAACLMLALPLAVPTAHAAGEEALAADVQGEALSVAQRRVLTATLAAYAEPRRGPDLDVARIEALVADMHWAAPPKEGLGKRFWGWLKRQLQEQDIEIDWLERMLYEVLTMPKSVADWIARLATVTMIVMALVILVNEIRRSNWRRTRRPAALAGSAHSGADSVAPTWQTVAELPPQDRPGAVLRLVLAALSARGLASSGEHHTHRQIAAEARRSGGSSAPLAQLAKMAERARYASWRLSAADGDEALALGRAIVGAKADGS